MQKKVFTSLKKETNTTVYCWTLIQVPFSNNLFPHPDPFTNRTATLGLANSSEAYSSLTMYKAQLHFNFQKEAIPQSRNFIHA